MNKKKNKKFTLIELIIVIVTISILAGMALPKFIDIKRDAEHAKLLNNIDVVEKSIAICELEKGDYPIYKDKVDFYSLNDTTQAQVLANGETGENLYKVRVNDNSKKTLSGNIFSKVFAEEEGTVLETEEFHTTLKYGLGKYGINDYYIYSKETGNVYYANGDLLDDSQSEITPICKDGTYYMTVNAGDTAQWIDHIANEYIPDGGSITYEWAAFDDPNLKKKNDKLNWTTDFSSLPNTQYLKTKITIKSPENGEQTKLLKYRVKYIINDIDYDEFDIENIQLKDVIKNSDGTYSSTSSNGGYISFNFNNPGGGYSHILNNFGGDYSGITISSGLSGSYGSYGSSGTYSLSNISSIPSGPVTINIPVPNDSSITIPQKVIAIKEKEEEWKTIDELTFECDAMEPTKWVGFDYDGFIPENTRIKVHFSTSDDDKSWSNEVDSIGSVSNSQIIRARIELQVNKQAKQIPSISEVFFDNEFKGRVKRNTAKRLNLNKKNEDNELIGKGFSNGKYVEKLKSEYKTLIYVDCNTEIEIDKQDGSINKPYKELDNVLNKYTDLDSVLIVLSEGTHNITSKYANISNKIGIIGCNERTNLNYISTGTIRSSDDNSQVHFNFTTNHNFYNLVLSTDATNSYCNYFYNGQTKVTFNNVAFGKLFDSGYSVFMSTINNEDKMGYFEFNNCTFTNNYNNLFRVFNLCGSTKNTISINNTYLRYSCYSSNNIELMDSINTSSIELDDKYKIMQEGIDNSIYGVYSGKYAW